MKSQSFTYGNFFTAEFVTEGYIMSYVRSRASLFILNFSFFELRHNLPSYRMHGVYGGVSDKWFTKSQSFSYGNFFTAEFVTEGYIMSYVRSRASLFILNFSFFSLQGFLS